MVFLENLVLNVENIDLINRAKYILSSPENPISHTETGKARQLIVATNKKRKKLKSHIYAGMHESIKTSKNDKQHLKTTSCKNLKISRSKLLLEK
jgi:hypothetical protein